MAVNLNLTLSGYAEAGVTSLRLDGTSITIAPNRSWSVTVPVRSAALGLIATLSDGREQTRVIQLIPSGGGVA